MVENPTEVLSDFALTLSFDDLPPEAVHRCKRHLLDTVAAGLAAAKDPIAEIVRAHVGHAASAGRSRIPGTDLETSVEGAAFATGILAHAMSFDDSGPSHPSVTVVPPLIAIGDAHDLSGRDILAAQVVGYEVFLRLNRVTSKARAIRDGGWHPTGFFGAVTSALISARLLRLTLEQAVNAVGIAASMGGGLSGNIGTMTMALHAGNAARNGTTAALLASRGFTADPEILGGRLGLMTALSGAGNYDIGALTRDLGQGYAVLDPGINIKPYPNCWGHHRYYQAMLELVSIHGFGPEDVERIVTDLQPEKSTCRYLVPENPYQAKYSIGYGLALCVIDRELTFDQYKPERIASPEVQSLLSRVEHSEQGDLDKPEKAIVRVFLKSGKVVSNAVAVPKGTSNGKPISDIELEEKFLDCAQGVFPDEKAEAAIKSIYGMDSNNSFRSIMDHLIV